MGAATHDRPAAPPRAQDRTDLLVLRVWVEYGAAQPLRARLLAPGREPGRPVTVGTAAGAGAICAMVRQRLDALESFGDAGAGTTDDMAGNDVIDLLLQQHQEIRRLFVETESTSGRAREETFDRLRRLLAVHETAEEELLHPEARRTLDDGDRVVDARLEEEKHAKLLLSDLEDVGPAAPTFDTLLAELKHSVLEHAEREEQEEFPDFRERHPAYQRQAMGMALRVAQALAPTHPHAGVESATANLLVGPYVAMLDRSRDVLRQAMRRLTGS